MGKIFDNWLGPRQVSNLDLYRHGVDQGWWPSFTFDGPNPWPYIYVISKKKLGRFLYRSYQ